MTHRSNHSRLYWPLQATSWILYGFVGYTINTIYGADVERYKVAGIAFSGAIILLISTHLLREYAKRKDWIKLTFGKLFLRLAIGTLLLSIASQLLISLLMFWPFSVFTPERGYSVGVLVVYIFQTQIILMLWSLIYFSFHAIRNYKSEEIERWRLEAAVKDAELNALRAQINPHFIFNCLNNIRALVLEDTEKAREAIIKLSDLLRYTIQSNKKKNNRLEEELAIVRSYLDLESIHMETRLSYQIDSPTKLDEQMVPSMSVQILVENAIKHGLSKLPAGGQVLIDVKEMDQHLQIEVRNTGKLLSRDEQSTGVGLRNIRERLHLLYGINAGLTLEQNGNDVVARIHKPLHTIQTS